MNIRVHAIAVVCMFLFVVGTCSAAGTHVSMPHDTEQESVATIALFPPRAVMTTTIHHVEPKKKDTALRRAARVAGAVGIGAVAGAILAQYEKKYGMSILRILLVALTTNAVVSHACSSKETPIADFAGLMAYMASYL